MAYYPPSTVNGTGQFSSSDRSGGVRSDEAGYQFLLMGCNGFSVTTTAYITVFANVSSTGIYTDSCGNGGIGTAGANVSISTYFFGGSPQSRFGDSSKNLWTDGPITCTAKTITHSTTAEEFTGSGASLTGSLTGNQLFEFHILIFCDTSAANTRGGSEDVLDSVHWVVSSVYVSD